MSATLLLLLALLVLLLLGGAILLRLRRRPKIAPAPPTPARGGLVFQRHVAPASRVAEMQQMRADKPPMFANTPAALDGEIAPDRLSSS
jgi:hypothetical protein